METFVIHYFHICRCCSPTLHRMWKGVTHSKVKHLWREAVLEPRMYFFFLHVQWMISSMENHISVIPVCRHRHVNSALPHHAPPRLALWRPGSFSQRSSNSSADNGSPVNLPFDGAKGQEPGGGAGQLAKTKHLTSEFLILQQGQCNLNSVTGCGIESNTWRTSLFSGSKRCESPTCKSNKIVANVSIYNDTKLH